MTQLRICKRCLLEDVKESELYEKIQRTIAAIAEEERTEEAEYQKRLMTCRACEKLINGMCRVCGCFVEVRAARIHSGCPAPGKLW